MKAGKIFKADSKGQEASQCSFILMVVSVGLLMTFILFPNETMLIMKQFLAQLSEKI